jgi:(2Fe-2S) ferredoxin
MTQTKVLVSGDPLSLSRKAEQTKLAFETELAKHGLDDAVEVSYTGKINRTDLLPAVIVYPDAAVYGPVTSEDVEVIVEEHISK